MRTENQRHRHGEAPPGKLDPLCTLARGQPTGRSWGDPDYHSGVFAAGSIVHLDKETGKIRSVGAEEAGRGQPKPHTY